MSILFNLIMLFAFREILLVINPHTVYVIEDSVCLIIFCCMLFLFLLLYRIFALIVLWLRKIVFFVFFVIEIATPTRIENMIFDRTIHIFH